MSVMFEVYYRPPRDLQREAALTNLVSRFGGRLDFAEEPAESPTGVILTYEFEEWEAAEQAAESLRRQGEHVEGPSEY